MALWGADACAKQMAGILALHRWPCNALVSSRPPRIHRNRCVAVASKSTGGKKGDKNKQAHKQAIITSNPVLARLIDGPLIMGDAVMMTATELSSQRIPLNEDTKWLLGVAVISWFLAAVICGDYRGRAPYNDNLYVQMILGPVFIGFLDCSVTWAVASVLASLGYALLVMQNTIDPAIIMDGLGTDDLSPQLEVAVAALIIMPCWRGMAIKLRNR